MESIFKAPTISHSFFLVEWPSQVARLGSKCINLFGLEHVIIKKGSLIKERKVIRYIHLRNTIVT